MSFNTQTNITVFTKQSSLDSVTEKARNTWKTSATIGTFNLYRNDNIQNVGHRYDILVALQTSHCARYITWFISKSEGCS